VARQQLRHKADPPDIFVAILFAVAQAFAQVRADHVAVQPFHLMTPLGQDFISAPQIVVFPAELNPVNHTVSPVARLESIDGCDETGVMLEKAKSGSQQKDYSM